MFRGSSRFKSRTKLVQFILLSVILGLLLGVRSGVRLNWMLMGKWSLSSGSSRIDQWVSFPRLLAIMDISGAVLLLLTFGMSVEILLLIIIKSVQFMA